MIEVKLSDIVVPENRFRREFDKKKLQDLKNSIVGEDGKSGIGLLNLITLERTEDESRGTYYLLRAGERRLQVLEEIAKEGGSFRCGDTLYSDGICPAVEFNSLTALQRLEIEVEENVVRSDFDWKERTQALTALHNLRKLQHPEQSITATATEVLGKPAVGDQLRPISNALIISRYLDDPDVAKAKSEGDALKIIKKKAERMHRAKLAINFDASKNPHTLLKGDSQEKLEKLPANSIDVIVADPHYGIGADGFGDMSGTGHDYDDSKQNFEALLKWMPDALYRVAKERAHCYLFCDSRNFERLHTFMVLAGWTAFYTPLVWDKCGTGMLPFPENGPRRTYESILYAWKGDRRTLMVKNDVIRVPAVKKLLTGAQKPVALYQDLLSRSANPGDHILDFCGGSGPVLVAANNMQLVATYIERDEAAFNIAVGRVSNTGFDDGSEEDDGIEISL